MLSFQDYWYRTRDDAAGRAAFEADMATLRARDASRECLNRRYYAHFAGRSVAAVTACGTAWFAALERQHKNLFHTAIVSRLQQHQARGDTVVLVSGSFPALLAPIARRLGVSHLLAIHMHVADGRYTGAIGSPQTIGTGKAVAVAAFLATAGHRAAECHAYGDDISDLPMLQAVGHPVVVGNGSALAAHAATAGWPVLAPF